MFLPDPSVNNPFGFGTGDWYGVKETQMVGERGVLERRSTVRTAGRSTSENVGMSSEKESENLSPRKPKGS